MSQERHGVRIPVSQVIVKSPGKEQRVMAEAPFVIHGREDHRLLHFAAAIPQVSLVIGITLQGVAKVGVIIRNLNQNPIGDAQLIFKGAGKGGLLEIAVGELSATER